MPRNTGGPWVRGPVNKLGYMVQANTLDIMWKTAAIYNTIPRIGPEVVDAQVIAPVAGTLIFGLINSVFPGMLAVGAGFGAALLAVGGVGYLIDKYAKEGSFIEQYEYAQQQAWNAYTAVTGVSVDQVLEYHQVKQIIETYGRTGIIRVSRRINPFEQISYHPDQGVDRPPMTGVRNYFEPLTYTAGQIPMTSGLSEITSAGGESNLFVPIQRAMHGFTSFVSVFSSPDEVPAEEVAVPEEVVAPEEVVDFVFEEIAPSPELAEAIIEELIESVKDVKEIIEETPHPDYIKPKILSDMKKNTFNKGILAPIALFILIIFFKRRRKKRK